MRIAGRKIEFDFYPDHRVSPVGFFVSKPYYGTDIHFLWWSLTIRKRHL